MPVIVVAPIPTIVSRTSLGAVLLMSVEERQTFLVPTALTGLKPLGIDPHALQITKQTTILPHRRESAEITGLPTLVLQIDLAIFGEPPQRKLAAQNCERLVSRGQANIQNLSPVH